MNTALVGLGVGMALAFAGWFGGFGAFLLVAALGAIGFVAGKFIDGDLDPDEFFRSRSSDRSRDRSGTGTRSRTRDRDGDRLR
ncbi:hypothetical protein G3I60_34565 [Streptomyces sp. SID13666]|uniref:hypothetical protein n=1 Tax=unclassified Streptomyces TaxID=2593676 RepID=UPI0013BEE655|nr:MULTISPECIES: hypothetical protein [unclassified Streptomyces]NEA59147.1 hypothetical protein [Streptomyces sp. SID13666]NEA75324.1 hypothetical protein [Streptomyces sp. SID13588]